MRDVVTAGRRYHLPTVDRNWLTIILVTYYFIVRSYSYSSDSVTVSYSYVLYHTHIFPIRVWAIP